MGQAEDLLMALASEEESMNVATEPHVVIGKDRFITVPEELKKIAVEHDHMIETVTFDCPRYWDKHDMSQMYIYVNYERADGEKGQDLTTNVYVDENDDSIMHFDWTITGHLTVLKGPFTFLVCIQNVAEDGTEENHWNSERCSDMYISEGLECEAAVIEQYPGIITSLLDRMDTVEENVPKYIEEYLREDADGIYRGYVREWLEENPASPEEMQGYIDTYFTNHPEEASAFVSKFFINNPGAIEQYVNNFLENAEFTLNMINDGNGNVTISMTPVSVITKNTITTYIDTGDQQIPMAKTY